MKDNVIELSKLKIRGIVDAARDACERNYSEERMRSILLAEAVERRKARLRNSGADRVIPVEMIDKIANADIENTKSANAVLSWINKSIPFLFILGSVGRGKTVAAAMILAEKDGFYIRAQVVESLFEQKYGIFVENQNALLDKRLLVVDDIGTERDPASFTTTLQRIVDSRQGLGFKTLFTSNLKKETIFERYQDERLLSRIKAMAVFVADVGEDMRSK